jgi:hypothetical protein
MGDASDTPSQRPAASAGSRARKRGVSGRPFAIGFGLFLVIGTIVFTYLARQAQVSRESAFEQMQEDGVVPRGD